MKALKLCGPTLKPTSESLNCRLNNIYIYSECESNACIVMET